MLLESTSLLFSHSNQGLTPLQRRKQDFKIAKYPFARREQEKDFLKIVYVMNNCYLIALEPGYVRVTLNKN